MRHILVEQWQKLDIALGPEVVSWPEVKQGCVTGPRWGVSIRYEEAARLD